MREQFEPADTPFRRRSVELWPDKSVALLLLVEERCSRGIDQIFSRDPTMVVWWGTSIECVSALSRLEREEKIGNREVEEVLARLRALRDCSAERGFDSRGGPLR